MAKLYKRKVIPKKLGIHRCTVRDTKGDYPALGIQCAKVNSIKQ